VRVLREIKLASSEVGKYRVSTIARWFWCAEQAYWQVRGIYAGAERQKVVGQQIHDSIDKEIKRWTWEIAFLKKLDQLRQEGYGFVRRIGKDSVFWDVTGHPDEFQVTMNKKVSIIEIKTTEIGEKALNFYIHYRLPTAIFQTEVYCYVLEPFIKQIGYELDRLHAVQVWHVKYQKVEGKKVMVGREHIQDFPVYYYPSHVERELLDTILPGLRDHDKVIPPRGAPNCFKCRGCSKVYKEKCQFWIKENMSM